MLTTSINAVTHCCLLSRDGRRAPVRERYAKVCEAYPEKVTVIRSQRELDRFVKGMEVCPCSST